MNVQQLHFPFLFSAAYLNTGIILMNQGKAEEAKKTFLKCSEIPDENLKDPHAHKSSVTSCLYNLGKLYHEQGQYEVNFNSNIAAIYNLNIIVVLFFVF